ncbi:MAG: hypothetical protein JW795_18675 [Chitinivibrionales bacterium]|nr:hypothetical protein [Chitinivibrionales bacterium]
MTTVIFIDKTCYVCAAKSRYANIGISPPMLGKPHDLDGRAATTQRSSIYLLVQKCPSCGYCAADISKGEPIIKEIMASAEYTDQLHDTRFPETADVFLCRSLLDARTGNYGRAGGASLCASWICDDSLSYQTAAFECRIKALQFFQLARENRQPFNPSPQEEALIIIECLRRTAQFSTALAECKKELRKTDEKEFRQLFDFEKSLIKKKDTTRHTRTEVLLG